MKRLEKAARHQAYGNPSILDLTAETRRALSTLQRTEITDPPGKGAREAFFVFAPSIANDTFLHLSARGGSYKIRNFSAGGPKFSPAAITVPGCRNLEALRASGVILRWMPASDEDLCHSLTKEPGYWHGRIQQVNSQELEQN